jgi:hypothetical protein
MGIGFPHDHLIADCGLRIAVISSRLERGVGALGIRGAPGLLALGNIIAKRGEFSLDSVAA